VKGWALRFQASIEQLTPEAAALLLSVGLVLGVFPVMGCPTLLCLCAGFGLRLNQPALQLINNVCSPLQLALLIPLERAGGWLCRGLPAGDGSVAAKIAAAALHAIAGWACICLPLGLVIYGILVFAMHYVKIKASECPPRPDPLAPANSSPGEELSPNGILLTNSGRDRWIWRRPWSPRWRINAT
jgi:hypothetical protein